jgi:hypothetical protein
MVQKEEPRYVYLSEAKASHSHKMWIEASSSAPHFLQVGLLLSPIIYRCLLKVLCPVRRPITTLDCVLLKDNSRALVARFGPEISSRACLCVLQGPRHNTRCCFSIQPNSHIMPKLLMRKPASLPPSVCLHGVLWDDIYLQI